MAKKKQRNSRWTYRSHLKRGANKHKTLSRMHPQVRRQVQEQDQQEKEL